MTRPLGPTYTIICVLELAIWALYNTSTILVLWHQLCVVAVSSTYEPGSRWLKVIRIIAMETDEYNQPHIERSHSSCWSVFGCFTERCFRLSRPTNCGILSPIQYIDPEGYPPKTPLHIPNAVGGRGSFKDFGVRFGLAY